VVIAVIAILASLLLPVLEGAKLRTQQTQCSSDLRQMAIAYRMYLDDVGAFEFVSPPVQPPLFSWPYYLNPYGVTPGVLLCPSAAVTNLQTQQIGNLGVGFGTADLAWIIPNLAIRLNGSGQQSIVGSYACNFNLLNLTGEYGTTGISPQSQFFPRGIPPHPSETPVFADAVMSYSYPLPTAPPTDLYSGGGEGIQQFVIARHGSRPASAAPRSVDISKPLPGMIDLALYDGHVEKSRLEDLWNYDWSANWEIWGNPRPGE
jgi:type II secretory pathway pseudopilin PulG